MIKSDGRTREVDFTRKTNCLSQRAGNCTYKLFNDINQNFNIPGVRLRAVAFVFPVAPDAAARSRDGLRRERAISNSINGAICYVTQ